MQDIFLHDTYMTSWANLVTTHNNLVNSSVFLLALLLAQTKFNEQVPICYPWAYGDVDILLSFSL